MKTENKNGLLVFLLPELLTVLAGSAGVYGLGIIARQLSAENALRDAVMTALGFAVAGFFLRRETLTIIWIMIMQIIRSGFGSWSGAAFCFLWHAFFCRREDGRSLRCL